MKLRKCLVIMGIVSVMGLFSACDVLEDAYDDPSVEKKEGQYYVDASTPPLPPLPPQPLVSTI